MACEINISKDFSTHPAGRYPTDGPFSGETFRKKHLVPALKKCDRIEVILDGTRGYPSSFLEEAFGGLVRSERYSLDILRNKMLLVAHAKHYEKYVGLAWQYIEKASAVE